MSSAITVAPESTTASSVKSFMSTTRDAVQDGIADARATVEEAWPKVAETINKGVYKLAYGVAFGLAFPVVLVAKSVPQNNCVVWGLVDGARSAKSAVDRLTAK
eukprot:TRINITY_DN32355_c0_g1_i1.p1 TRINITY_DN32355_c0_g1~~TRINITY_DN32355_c0_g1_i1.p1  ORF type:complete len:104 (+),score=5.22 TRINITY_DN32355_c0_g1_i1:212-523(+)